MVVVQVINGTGSYVLNVQRSADVTPPSVNSISFNSQTINNGEELVINIDSSDNLEILNTTVYYHTHDTSDPWITLGYLIDTSSFILEYGNWDLMFRTFDVSNNYVESTNSGMYYQIQVLDKEPPVLNSIDAFFDINIPTNVTVEVSDELSGIAEVIIQYTVNNISLNLTATMNSDNLYEVTIPAIGANQTVTLKVIIKDQENNYFVSSEYDYYIGDILISVEVVYGNETIINSPVDVVANIESNDGLQSIKLYYILPNSNNALIIEINELLESKSYEFTLISGNEGTVSFWIEINTNNGGIFISQNYTITVLKINVDPSSTPSTSSPIDTSGENIPNKMSGDTDTTLILASVGLFMISGILILSQNWEKLLSTIKSIRKRLKTKDF